jgi:pimeloyl-ACP methyl ester carboxylesterase
MAKFTWPVSVPVKKIGRYHRFRATRDAQQARKMGVPRRCAGAALLMTLLWSGCALAAEPRVILLRGWFGVFSTGLDSLADKLRAAGVNVQVVGHEYWDSAVADILRERTAGKAGPLVLVGHSQGANNAVSMAHYLKPHKVSVDLLVTLAPFLQYPVPSNVVHAINYYQAPGWGTPLTAEPNFSGKLSNIDLASDLTIFHITIDKSSKIHAEIAREIADLSRQQPAVAQTRVRAEARAN